MSYAVAVTSVLPTAVLRAADEPGSATGAGTLVVLGVVAAFGVIITFMVRSLRKMRANVAADRFGAGQPDEAEPLSPLGTDDPS